jgi:MFS family permease
MQGWRIRPMPPEKPLRRTPRRATFARLDALERQLRRLRHYALVTYPFACVPFLFPFFVRHGMGAAEYGEILGAYYLAMFVAEVPTGVLADRIGPRPMLVLGPCVLAAGFSLLLLWPTHAGFLCAEALLGLGHAVLSGPPTVMLYESLRRAGQQHRYLVEESAVNARRLYGTGASFLLGGLCVHFGDADGAAFGLAIVVTSALCLAAALVASSLTVLPLAPRTSRSFLLRLRHDLLKPAVLWLVAYWVVLFSLLRFPFHNYQPYLLEVAPQEPLFAHAVVVGLLFAALNLFAAPLAGKLPGLVERHGRRVLFWGMPLLLSVSLALMGAERSLGLDGSAGRLLAWLGVAMFFVQQVPFGMHQALLYDFVNHRIGSATRTTLLSALSLIARASYAVINVGLFHLQAARGMATALWAAGAGGAALTAIVLWLRPRGLLRGKGPVA